MRPTNFEKSESSSRPTCFQPAPAVLKQHPGSNVPCPGEQRFEPYFQPLVELRSGRLAGVEMLARCWHSTEGLLLPDAFIPQAEREGWLDNLLLQLTRLAAVQLQGTGQSVNLSINLSPMQLRDRRLPAQVETVAASAGLSLRCVTFEVTETALAINQPCCITVAHELKELGCRLSLDDFGTGYSSLLQLQALPFDEIKIDRQFIGSMVDRQESRKIVSAVIGLSQSLGLRTVGEGVETTQQSEMLRWLGCDIGQGWLYGRPMPGRQLRELLQQPQARPTPVRLLAPGYASLESPATRLAQLRAVFDGVPVGLAFLDKQLRYTDLNERMAQMNGCSVEEHLGQHIGEVLPHLFSVIEPYLRRALQGNAIHDVELPIIQGPGTTPYMRWFSYQPALDQAGEVVGLCIAVCNRTLSLQDKPYTVQVGMKD